MVTELGIAYFRKGCRLFPGSNSSKTGAVLPSLFLLIYLEDKAITLMRTARLLWDLYETITYM